jgi:hypothetical protein
MQARATRLARVSGKVMLTEVLRWSAVVRSVAVQLRR